MSWRTAVAVTPSTKQQKIDNLTLLQSRRLCIICAKSTEADIVQKQFQTTQKIPGHLVHGISPGNDFHLGVMGTDAGELPYYITAASRQGIQSFAVEAAVLFSILQPEYAIHAGTCAALGGDAGIQLQDVVFGDRATNYEEGKWKAETDGQLTFLPDTKIFDTKSAAMDGFVEGVRRVNYKYGDYISGCALRMDAQHIMDRVRHQVLRDVKALDMEASAFLQVCDHMGVRAFGIIKGVSDKGDAQRTTDKADVWLQAMTNAANALKEYLKWKLKEDPPEPALLDKQPGARIAAAYFEEFVRVVVMKVSDLSFKIPIDNEDILVKGLRIVLPRNNMVSKRASLRYFQQSFELKEVSLTGGDRTTPISYKGQYFIDFPPDLKQLADLPDVKTQVGYFKTALSQALEEININPRGFSVDMWEFEMFAGFCMTIDDQEKPRGN